MSNKNNKESKAEEQSSVFANITKVETIMQDKIVKQTETEEILPTKNISFNKNVIYSIMCGNDENEYFSFELPEIMGNNIVIKNSFIKGIIRQNILGTVIEEFYKAEAETNVKKFNLTLGVLIKEYNIAEHSWINKTFLEAQNGLKDLMLMKYQDIVPALMNKLENFEAQLTQNKRRNNNDSLLEL